MKKILLTGLLLSVTFFLFAQDRLSALINAAEAERIERVLASDEMRGRKVFSPEIDKAADFIESEFRAIGLRTMDASDHFRQEFSMIRPKLISKSVVLDGITLDPSKIVAVTSATDLKFDNSGDVEVLQIGPKHNLAREAAMIKQFKKNMLVIVDTAHAGVFQRLNKRSLFKTERSIVFVLGNKMPSKFSVEVKNEISEQRMANVVGMIPGKSRKDEIVIFSAHYDHVGVGKAVDGDSIYNGANDDAAGTTAVMMLARYFKDMKNNERTLVFAAFTAEEIGGYGSQFFSKQFDAERVVAMFNIEMIGTESKWGKNSAFITGFDKTDMGTILQKNLEGSEFKFHPDPYPEQDLFYRSDNATMARLGVPAHTISTAKMDKEPHYHKVTDHVETLDMTNMAMIIRAIAISSTGIITGKETPKRVQVEELRF